MKVANYENKMMTTSTGGVTVIWLDDEMKQCPDGVLRKFELSGNYTAEGKEKTKIMNILFGKDA